MKRKKTDSVGNCTSSTSFTQVIESQHKIQRSRKQFYQKTTKEVKEFSNPNKYEQISPEKNKILNYRERIFFK